MRNFNLLTLVFLFGAGCAEGTRAPATPSDSPSITTLDSPRAVEPGLAEEGGPQGPQTLSSHGAVAVAERVSIPTARALNVQLKLPNVGQQIVWLDAKLITPRGVVAYARRYPVARGDERATVAVAGLPHDVDVLKATPSQDGLSVVELALPFGGTQHGLRTRPGTWTLRVTMDGDAGALTTQFATTNVIE